MRTNIPKGRITFINEVLCKYDPAGTTSPNSDEYLTEATDISRTLWNAFPFDQEFNDSSREDVVFNVILGVLWQKFGFMFSANNYKPSFRKTCVNEESVRLAAKEIVAWLIKGDNNNGNV